MRISLLVTLGLVGVCWTSDLLETKLLDFVHGHALGNLQQSERILFAQLIACAERYELKEFIEVVGIQPIVQLLVGTESRVVSTPQTATSMDTPDEQSYWIP